MAGSEGWYTGGKTGDIDEAGNIAAHRKAKGMGSANRTGKRDARGSQTRANVSSRARHPVLLFLSRSCTGR